MAAERKVAIVWNQRSGTFANAVTLRELIYAKGDIIEVALTKKLDLEGAIALLINKGINVVAAAGGDGTVNAVASALIPFQHKASLAILPLGTGNDFARSLGVPTDLAEAFGLMYAGVEARIDAVEARGSNGIQSFVNVATGGISTRVSKENKGIFKKWFGPFSYMVKALTTAFRPDRFQLNVELDGRSLNIIAANVIIANGRFVGGGTEVAPRAELCNGRMDVIIVKDYSNIDLVRLSAKVLAGGDLLEDDTVYFTRAKYVFVKSHPNFRFSLDGEVGLKTPIGFSVMPEALSVIRGNPL